MPQFAGVQAPPMPAALTTARNSRRTLAAWSRGQHETTAGNSSTPPTDGGRGARCSAGTSSCQMTTSRTAPGGFSPGLAARIVGGDGRRWFVKAASGQVNPDSPRLHRQEARILGGLDPLIRSRAVASAAASGNRGAWLVVRADPRWLFSSCSESGASREETSS